MQLALPSSHSHQYGTYSSSTPSTPLGLHPPANALPSSTSLPPSATSLYPPVQLPLPQPQSQTHTGIMPPASFFRPAHPSKSSLPSIQAPPLHPSALNLNAHGSRPSFSTSRSSLGSPPATPRRPTAVPTTSPIPESTHLAPLTTQVSRSNEGVSPSKSFGVGSGSGTDDEKNSYGHNSSGHLALVREPSISRVTVAKATLPIGARKRPSMTFEHGGGGTPIAGTPSSARTGIDGVGVGVGGTPSTGGVRMSFEKMFKRGDSLKRNLYGSTPRSLGAGVGNISGGTLGSSLGTGAGSLTLGTSISGMGDEAEKSRELDIEEDSLVNSTNVGEIEIALADMSRRRGGEGEWEREKVDGAGKEGHLRFDLGDSSEDEDYAGATRKGPGRDGDKVDNTFDTDEDNMGASRRVRAASPTTPFSNAVATAPGTSRSNSRSYPTEAGTGTGRPPHLQFIPYPPLPPLRTSSSFNHTSTSSKFRFNTKTHSQQNLYQAAQAQAQGQWQPGRRPAKIAMQNSIPTMPVLSKSEPRRPLRNYHLISSQNRFFLNGHIVLGGNTPWPFIGVLVIVFGIAGVWFGTTAVWWWKEESPAVAAVGAYLSLLTISSMLMTAMRDPGILPRNLDLDPPYSNESPVDGEPRVPLPRDLRVRTGVVRVKYCITCKTYRPPRSSHCKTCDNCVDGCDHHCQWVNNCVGRRNYTTFITFLVAAVFTLCLIIVTSALHLYLLTHTRGLDFKHALAQAPGSAVVFCMSILVVWPVLALMSYHVRLLLLNITTIEQVRNQAHSSIMPGPAPPNPFSLSTWYHNLAYILCRPAGYSWVNPSGIAVQDQRKLNPGLAEGWLTGGEDGRDLHGDRDMDELQMEEGRVGSPVIGWSPKYR
ncbi:hypothetical protein BOTBODRAFT_180857 [Botryobasidium botryosum FD-172 SS1]|uniref:Palmitoyltransferase n=1 Tax=Botryobasidium botryosum (strain FD-172 SS1) TaxID=930990 RepID=A0A067LVS3_BOTB1|nr:hypothetical protein BOTBODRAFT_180857 [Botryobasidium botryosum FD-172 SS1]